MACRRPGWTLARTDSVVQPLFNALIEPVLPFHAVTNTLASLASLPTLELARYLYSSVNRQRTLHKKKPPKACNMRAQHAHSPTYEIPFEKNKRGFVPRGDHQRPSIDYNDPPSSVMRPVMAATDSTARKCTSIQLEPNQPLVLFGVGRSVDSLDSSDGAADP